MNISQTTIDTLKQLFTVSFYNNNANETEPKKATCLYIGCEKINGSTVDANGFFHNCIYKSIKTGVKEITVEWVLSKVNAEKTYTNFCSAFNKLLPTGLNAYPTSYGIGVFVAIGFRNQINETKSTIEALLLGMDIVFNTEYSEAGWVFRYKISKSSQNINTINKIAA